eukprot:g6581.t1
MPHSLRLPLVSSLCEVLRAGAVDDDHPLATVPVPTAGLNSAFPDDQVRLCFLAFLMGILGGLSRGGIFLRSHASAVPHRSEQKVGGGGDSGGAGAGSKAGLGNAVVFDESVLLDRHDRSLWPFLREFFGTQCFSHLVATAQPGSVWEE